jgi:hypothetical protein
MLVNIITSFIMDKETREEEAYMSLLNNHHHYDNIPSPSNGYFHRSSQRSIPKYGTTHSINN